MEFKKCHWELEPGTASSRRFHLIILAATSLAMAGLSGCGKSPETQKAEAAAVEVQKTGRITLKSNRANSTFELKLAPANGQVDGFTANGSPGQTLTGLLPGKYTVTARSAGWPDIPQEVNVNAGLDIDVEFVFPSGSLRLDSQPSGFTVMRGSTNLGKTPLVVPELPPGDISLTLEAPLWPPLTYLATITANEETAATARIPHGRLSIDSSPSGATVVFAGHALGRTPMVVKTFQAGTKKLTLQSKEFPPLDVTVVMEDHGELSIRPLLAESYPELSPEALLRAVWVDTKAEDPDRLSPAFGKAINYRPRNGLVKNLDRKKLFETWLDKPYRFTGLIKAYNPQTGQIEYTEENNNLTRYRVMATLSPTARGDKELTAQLVKGAVFVFYGILSAVEEPKWPAKAISIEFDAVEPLR